LKLWIPAQDTLGVWTVFYTQATKVNGVWTVGNFTTLHAPLMTTKNTQYLYTPKQWVLLQGDSPKSHGVKRKINEVWGYKTGHTPKTTAKNMGAYTQIEVVPTDLQNVSNYQVMIPASMLNISSQSDSLDVERA
jgi:predicted cupin superfamily sugar epimerase